MRVRTEVRAIDLDRRVLTVFERSEQRETEEGFDELVIATGAVAVPPPIPGAEAAETARTVDAAERFRAGLERGGGKAVVIGAGYIGLEMAENLVDRGMAVTVDRPGRPGDADASTATWPTTSRTAPRRTACASCSRRRSRRSRSTTRASPAACGRARASCPSTT